MQEQDKAIRQGSVMTRDWWQGSSNLNRLKGYQQRAVHLYLAAKNAYDSIGAWPKEHDLKFEDYLIPGRAALGESAFAEAVEQGRAMTMEQAVAYALETQE